MYLAPIRAPCLFFGLRGVQISTKRGSERRVRRERFVNWNHLLEWEMLFCVLNVYFTALYEKCDTTGQIKDIRLPIVKMLLMLWKWWIVVREKIEFCALWHDHGYCSFTRRVRGKSKEKFWSRSAFFVNKINTSRLKDDNTDHVQSCQLFLECCACSIFNSDISLTSTSNLITLVKSVQTSHQPTRAQSEKSIWRLEIILRSIFIKKWARSIPQ